MIKEEHGLHIDLWEKYGDGVRRLCEYKLQSSPNDIEDVISDTFLILCKAIEYDVQIENYGGWIYGVANNLIKRIYIKNNIAVETLVDFREGTEEFLNIKIGYDIDSRILDDSSIEEMKDEILNSLSPSEKIIISMFHEENKRMKEIAEKLNITEKAAKQKHYRTVRKIKRAVKELLGDS